MIKTFSIKEKIVGAGIPKVCVPLVGGTEEELISKATKITEYAKKYSIDMVEFRGDFFDKLCDMVALERLMRNLGDILSDIVLLFTIRSEREGGEKLGFTSPSIYDINKYVIDNRLSDMVDIELFSEEPEIQELLQLAKAKNVKIIMSNHDFNNVPAGDEIVSRLCRMQDFGADVAKIAVMPHSNETLFDFFKAIDMMYEKFSEVPLVAICMGKQGAISRICGELIHSAITFSTLEGASAPGQIPVEDVNICQSMVHKYCIE